jgi:hypothetical protein
MKFKTILLGSATALAVGGVAQAADLSVAEPVDYVRVCDAFGAGYFYAPGTDTCLQIGGFLRFDAVYSSAKDNVHWTSSSVDESSWNFTPAAYLTVSAKSMTDWGPLTGYFAFYTNSDMGSVVLDEAFISVGPLLVGYTESLFNYDGILTIDDNNGGQLAYSRGNVDQIRLSWAMNGFGLAISLEDPDKRSGASSVKTTDYGPDIVAALTASAGSMSGKLAFVYSPAINYWDSSYVDWAVNLGLTFKLDSLAPGDKLLLAIAYGAAPYAAGTGWGNMWWWNWDDPTLSVTASFQHFFAPNLSTAITVNYADASASNWDSTYWGVRWNVNYQPVKNLAIIPELRWDNYKWGDNWSEGDNWTGMLRIERYFP